MGIFRFDCVFYYVSDLDRAVGFYEQVLGFHLRSRDEVARFDVDGVLFELVPAPDVTLLSGHGNARLTLAVDDLDVAAGALRARGVPVSDVRDVSNGRLASLLDPDHNEIVLWQPQGSGLELPSRSPRRGDRAPARSANAPYPGRAASPRRPRWPRKT